MLNDLVNSTGPYCSSYNRLIESCLCEDITELFECYNEVKCQSNENSCSLQKLSEYIDCDNGNIDANDISASSAFINGLVACGINANSVTATNVSAHNKLEATCVEAENISADNLNVSNISASNLTGLTSLTVEGQATVDKLLADEIETADKITASSIETSTAKITTLDSTNIETSSLSATCIETNCLEAENAVIEDACIGNLSTSCFSADEIATTKISSTSLSVPKLETSGGITGTGTIDTTSAVWKEIRISSFTTGTIQLYTDEWKVTIVGGKEFLWEDPTLDHLKFISSSSNLITVAVDWDGEVYYTYNVTKNAPNIALVDNTGNTPANDYTYIMKDSGVVCGTTFIYQDKEFTNQGLTILGNVKASNLEITCGESIDCLSIENLYIGNTIRSDNAIDFDICARNFCVSSPCTYITNCLYTDNIEANCICSCSYLWTNSLYFDNIQMINCAKSPKQVVTYKDGLLCNSYKVCVDDDTVYSPDICACNIYSNEIDAECVNADTVTAEEAVITTNCSCKSITDTLSVNQCALFNGPVYIYDNIYQCGETYCTHAQNICTCSDTITMREGADFAGAAQIKVLKYDGTNNGIIQLGTDGTLRIGDEANCQPVLTRSEVSDISDGHVLVWDAVGKCAKDGGDAIVTCEYVHCVGKECAKGSCNFTCYITDECYNKSLACAYSCSDKVDACVCTFAVTCSNDIGTSCKNAACTFASACGHLIGTSCKNAACTFASACGHLIGTSCKNASCTFASACGHLIGTSCKSEACTYAENIGTTCKSAACTYAENIGTTCKSAACTYAENIGTSCKSTACTYANSVAGQCKTAACTYANTIATCCRNAACTYAENIGTSCKSAACTYAKAYTDSVISNACTYANSVAGQCKTAACTYANSVAGQCKTAACTYANTIATCCRNAACSFTVACVSAAQPDTSPFACSFGGSRTCVSSSSTTWMSGNNNNSFYKVPFTCFAAASSTAQNMPLYVDSVNVFPSYNPNTNVGCHYTLCVAQTLAVRNANGGFRLGSYCIYIG